MLRQPAVDASDPRENGSLRHREPNGKLVSEEARNRLLAGADELFRGIYTRAGVGAQEVLAVSSAIAGEGKTTISLGLAVTIAEDFPDRRVLVVETDLERSVLARDFGLDPQPGLVDCLLEDLPIQTAYRTTQLDNLDLVLAGGPASNPGRLLRTNQMATAVDAMRHTHGLIILDIPPILVNSDALILTDLADGVIFVVRTAVTPSPLVTKALAQLEEDKLRGVILNGVHSAVPGWLRRLCGL